jgi:hypothetical protein
MGAGCPSEIRLTQSKRIPSNAANLKSSDIAIPNKLFSPRVREPRNTNPPKNQAQKQVFGQTKDTQNPRPNHARFVTGPQDIANEQAMRFFGEEEGDADLSQG